MVRELIVAIDGPSAAGKSTAGTRVAKRLEYLYIESGAFYRALAWKVRELGIGCETWPAGRRGVEPALAH